MATFDVVIYLFTGEQEITRDIPDFELAQAKMEEKLNAKRGPKSWRRGDDLQYVASDIYYTVYGQIVAHLSEQEEKELLAINTHIAELKNSIRRQEFKRMHLYHKAGK